MKKPQESDQAVSKIFYCSCGCKAQLMMQVLPQGQVMVDTKVDGRHCWVGVVLDRKDRQKLQQILYH